MIEKTKHLEAFEYYYGLGHKRTLSNVAEEYGLNVGTISSWAREFEWGSRVEARDRILLERLKRNNADESDKAIILYQQGIRKTLQEEFLKPLKKGLITIKIENTKDLERLMKLDVLLSGGVTERTETLKTERKNSEQKVIDMVQSDDDVWEKLNEKYME
ncbi:MAG: hypothetical protein K8E24_014375 [Methanobacterium paludis]|nr:hypothetical protein [Methanobacterium paludis]